MNNIPKTLLPPLEGSHTRFAVVSAACFALLYTETGAYSVRTAGTRDPNQMALLLGVASLLIFGGFLSSLVLPVRRHEFPVGDFANARPVVQSLTDQFVMGSLLFVAASCGALVIYVWLVWPNLVSVYNLVKDLFIYTMTGLIYYQLLVTFVRYLTYLYATRMDNATKVIAAELGFGVFTLVMGLYLLTLDVNSLALTSDASGLTGLHIAVRDIWMAILIMLGYGWHLKRVADH
jgi:hypothetical protein